MLDLCPTILGVVSFRYKWPENAIDTCSLKGKFYCCVHTSLGAILRADFSVEVITVVQGKECQCLEVDTGIAPKAVLSVSPVLHVWICHLKISIICVLCTLLWKDNLINCIKK